MGVRLLRYPQYPWNNGIPMIVEVTLEKPVDKVEILATTSTLGGVKIKPQERTYYMDLARHLMGRFVVLPYVPGEHRINFTVVTNQAGVIDSASVSAFVNLTTDLRVRPIDSVTTGLYWWYRINFVLLYVFLFFVLAYLFVTVFFRHFAGWMYKEVTKAV